MVSDCCGASLLQGLETALCSECREHCNTKYETYTDKNLNDVIVTLKSLMKRLQESGVNDIEELPIVIDDVGKIQNQIYTLGKLIKQTQKEKT